MTEGFNLPFGMGLWVYDDGVEVNGEGIKKWSGAPAGPLATPRKRKTNEVDGIYI